MSKSKTRRRPAAPKADPYAGMTPARRRLHQRADAISARFARVDQTFNRVLLAIFVIAAALWLFKVIPTATARYLIVALLGISMALNGIAGYRASRWAGFFLMVFGTLLMLGNLYMLLA